MTPILDGAGVLVDEQLEARDWWEREDGVAYPGQPYKLSATPSARRGPAPALGAHGDGPSAPARPAPAAGADRRRRRRPLEGVRIIEVTTNWAGPVAGRFLADLGADSVKVEWQTRPATRALVWVGPFQDLQRQPHHRALYFNEMNRNKRGVCIDMSNPEGRAAFLELVKSADVVIENNSARVMGNFGLAYDDLRAVNPSIIMVSMSGYGSYGPTRDWVAYGANIETTSSLTSITGYPDGQLSRTTLFYADPVSGNYAAVAIMAALRHRARTGEGQWVDMSLNECGVTFCADALLEYQRTGELRAPMGNRDPAVAPQGVYRCIGTDNWVALTVRSGEEWTAVAELIGRPDLAADASLADLAGRHARHDELDEAISAWTAGLEQYEIAEALQARRRPRRAGAGQLADHARPAHLRAGHVRDDRCTPSSAPTRRRRGRGASSGRRPGSCARRRCSPSTTARSSHEAGLDDDAIEALYAAGATADEPTPPE